MSTAAEIEKAIRELPPAELERLRVWFAEFEAERWDRELAEDVAAGALDALADEAVAEHRSGGSTPR